MSSKRKRDENKDPSPTPPEKKACIDGKQMPYAVGELRVQLIRARPEDVSEDEAKALEKLSTDVKWLLLTRRVRPFVRRGIAHWCQSWKDEAAKKQAMQLVDELVYTEWEDEISVVGRSESVDYRAAVDIAKRVIVRWDFTQDPDDADGSFTCGPCAQGDEDSDDDVETDQKGIVKMLRDDDQVGPMIDKLRDGQVAEFLAIALASVHCNVDKGDDDIVAQLCGEEVFSRCNDARKSFPLLSSKFFE